MADRPTRREGQDAKVESTGYDLMIGMFLYLCICRFPLVCLQAEPCNSLSIGQEALGKWESILAVRLSAYISLDGSRHSHPGTHEGIASTFQISNIPGWSSPTIGPCLEINHGGLTKRQSTDGPVQSGENSPVHIGALLLAHDLDRLAVLQESDHLTGVAHARTPSVSDITTVDCACLTCWVATFERDGDG